jgi:predicted metal-dependent HD superfamily phosphohydrolase
VHEYILATKHHQLDVSDKDLALFLDMDMSILGSCLPEYLAYARAIRKEYSHISDDVYCAKRADVLRGFLAGTIFHTTAFSLWEDRARTNLMHEVAFLDEEKLPAHEVS